MTDVLKKFRKKIYEHAHKMLNDRGYTTIVEKLSTDDFNEMETLNISDVKKTILLTIPMYSKKGSFIEDNYKITMRSIKFSKFPNLKEIIIITNKFPTQTMFKYIEKDTRGKKYRIYYMHYKNLLIDLPNHSLCYEHKLIEDDLKNSTYYKEDLPKIFETDKFSIWYGARRGDIFKILRKHKRTITDLNSPDIGFDNFDEIVYRVVTKHPKIRMYP